MPTFKNKLDELLADAVLASGVQRQIALKTVRDYLEKNPIDKLRTEIAQITSLTELNFLQAAGVPFALQDTYLFVVSNLSTKLR